PGFATWATVIDATATCVLAIVPSASCAPSRASHTRRVPTDPSDAVAHRRSFACIEANVLICAPANLSAAMASTRRRPGSWLSHLRKKPQHPSYQRHLMVDHGGCNSVAAV